MPTIAIFGVQVIILVARIEAHELLEKKSLTTLVLAPKSIIWKSGKEVLVAGKLFDIKSSHLNKAGNYVLTGLYDDQETKLISTLDALKNKDAKRQGAILQKFFSFQFNICRQEAEVYNPSKLNLMQLGNSTSAKLQKGYILIFSPPPQS